MAKSKMIITYKRPVAPIKVKHKKIINRSAEDMITTIIQNIFDEKKPNRRAQKRNRPSTINAKRKKGVTPPDRPLFGEKELFTKRTTYRKKIIVTQRGGTVNIDIRDRSSRKQIQKKLARLGYEHMGVPKRTLQKIARLVNQQVAAALNISAKSVKKVTFRTR